MGKAKMATEAIEGLAKGLQSVFNSTADDAMRAATHISEKSTNAAIKFMNKNSDDMASIIQRDIKGGRFDLSNPNAMMDYAGLGSGRASSIYTNSKDLRSFKNKLENDFKINQNNKFTRDNSDQDWVTDTINSNPKFNGKKFKLKEDVDNSNKILEERILEQQKNFEKNSEKIIADMYDNKEYANRHNNAGNTPRPQYEKISKDFRTRETQKKYKTGNFGQPVYKPGQQPNPEPIPEIKQNTKQNKTTSKGDAFEIVSNPEDGVIDEPFGDYKVLKTKQFETEGDYAVAKKAREIKDYQAAYNKKDYSHPALQALAKEAGIENVADITKEQMEAARQSLLTKERSRDLTLGEKMGYNKVPQKVVGVGSTMWLVNNLFSSKGEQTNSQLYGQQPMNNSGGGYY